MDGVPSSSSSLPSTFWPALIVILASFTYLIKTLPHILIPRKIKLPPGPKPWPIVGNLPEMVSNRPTFKWLHKLMKDLDTEIACIRLGNVHVIPVTSPAIACEFLKKNDAVFASRPLSMSAELISDGYMTAIISPFGGQWKKMKRIISSELFSPNRLKWLHGRRIEEAGNLVWYVYNLCKNDQHKGGLVNLRIVTQQYCGNLVRKMVFNKRYFGEGKKDGGPGFEELEHIEAVFTLLKYLYNFCVSDFMPCLRVFDFDGQEKMLRKALGIIRKYHDPIIEERIQQWKDGEREVQDLLDVLITLKDAHGKPLLTLEEIKAQIIELMIAIVDNPSNAVEWAIAEMINQPHLFQKAIEELDKVVGKDRLVQESDFSKLNYVKACAREAFRLHPVVPFTPPHVSMEDTTVANYFIPKGSHVILSRMGLGRNPRVWNDPNRFKPERHLKNSDGSECDNVILTEQELRFMSFSTGRRGCPGVGLGSAMTVMLFARLLHCFTWSVPSDEKSINLAESENDISLAKPLVATGKPRLAADLYVPH